MKRNEKFVWESAFIRSDIKGSAGFIGLVMATFDNGDGKGFFISQADLAWFAGLDVRTVRSHLKRLTDAGWIRVVRRGGNQGGTARASSYELTIPYPSWDEEPKEPTG